MFASRPPLPEFCTCLAIRQAARHVSQYYDEYLARAGLRTTQFSILAKLKDRGQLTINELAEAMVMDRTTLARNIVPLQRNGHIVVARGTVDRRSKQLSLTDVGHKRLRKAWRYWSEAQAGFGAAFGIRRDTELRALMRTVTSTELAADSTKP